MIFRALNSLSIPRLRPALSRTQGAGGQAFEEVFVAERPADALGGAQAGERFGILGVLYARPPPAVASHAAPHALASSRTRRI